MPSGFGGLPDFPWDTPAPTPPRPARTRAASSTCRSGRRSIRSPPLIHDALAAAANTPGLPHRRRHERGARCGVDALHRRYGVTGLSAEAVLPVIGTKELIAWLPTLLGLGPDDSRRRPGTGLPDLRRRRAVGRLARGRRGLADAIGPAPLALVFVNSPGNPTGRVLGVEHLRKVVGWARERDVVVASDECYLGLGWDAEPGVGAAPLGLRRRPHGTACGALVVEDDRRSPVTGPVSSPATPRWSPSCWRSASTPA